MPYQQVQYIAYVINTAPQRNNGIKTYLGLPDAAEDIDARCQLILRAIQTAQANIAQSSPPEAPGTTLKIFLAPEFYFRGSTGAYDMDSVQLAISALQNMVKGDEWNDWLFGFGSILGLSAPTFPYPPYNINPAAKKEVYNFTLLQRGGSANQGPQGANVVTKELKSGIDFITQTQSANNTDILIGNVNYLPPASSSGPGRERQQLNYDGAGICTISDITFGVEICLDHSAETAPGVYVGRLQQSPQLPNEPQIQIQLIPSCGMTIHNAQVMTEINGYVFH